MASGPLVQHITPNDNVHKGQRRTVSFDIKKADGTRQSIVGWTMNWRLYAFRGADAVLTTISGANIQLTSSLADATTDRVVVTIDNNTLDTLPIGKLYHKASRTDVDNEGDVAVGDFWLMG